MLYFATILFTLGLQVAALLFVRSPRVQRLLPNPMACHLVTGVILTLGAWLLVLELTHSWEPLTVTETTHALFGR